MEVVNEILEVLISFANNWGELFIAALALLVSIIAMIKASKAEKLQTKINELELQIKQYELDKIKKEQDEARGSNVEARVVTIGKGKHRLKVWNSGNTTAYNVTASFAGNPGIIIMSRDKQPFDELEPGKNYELILVVYANHESKFRIMLEWEDENGEKKFKMQMGDL